MAKVFFINPSEPKCGVYQYGINLLTILAKSKKHECAFEYLKDWQLIEERFNQWRPDVMIWNHHPFIPSPLNNGKPRFDCKHVLVKHEPTEYEKNYDRVIFSDPTAQDYDNVRHIGRPLPEYQITPRKHTGSQIKIGLHGFGGACATDMIQQVERSCSGHMSNMVFHIHLPYATYGDADGAIARDYARQIIGVLSARRAAWKITHNFIKMEELINWLAQNDVNCYVRELIHWPGVSSALDLALACGRPIAVNKCEAFRHFWNCEPSICLEDRSLEDIITSGDEPLKPLREKWSADRVLGQIESVIDEIL